MGACDAEMLLFGDEQDDYQAAHDAFEKADSELDWATLAMLGDLATMWGGFLASGGRGALGFAGGAAKGIADEGRFDNAVAAYDAAWDALQDATNALSDAADFLCECLGEESDPEGHGGTPGVDYPIEDGDGNPVDRSGNPWSPW